MSKAYNFRPFTPVNLRICRVFLRVSAQRPDPVGKISKCRMYAMHFGFRGIFCGKKKTPAVIPRGFYIA